MMFVLCLWAQCQRYKYLLTDSGREPTFYLMKRKHNYSEQVRQFGVINGSNTISQVNLCLNPFRSFYVLFELTLQKGTLE